MMTNLFLGIAIAFILGRLVTRYQYEFLLKQSDLVPSTLPSGYKQLLTHFNFYQALPPRSKKIFEFRMARFIKMKEFIPRQMTHVTDEMKVLISASAIQITFGLPKIFLHHFRYILIYPDEFYSQANQQYHKGEVNPMKNAIVLSWKHFVEGYIENEGINLGLHEMAHALQLENIVANGEYGFLKEEDVNKWRILASEEIEKMRSGAATFFREYASSNHAEFFAVAVENFFERPIEFDAYHHTLYMVMTDLLNQDPLQLIKGDSLT